MKTNIKQFAIRCTCTGLAVLMCALSFMLAPTPKVQAASSASTQSLQEKQKELQAEQKKLENKINSLKNEAAATLENKQYLDSLVTVVTAKIQNSEALIKELDNQITETEKAIAEHTKEIEKTEEKIKERMRANHEEGNVSYFDVILGSVSVSDFLSRMEKVNTILEHDKETLAQYEAEKKELQEKKESLEASKKLQEDTLKTLEADKKKNQQLSEQSANYINSLNADKKEAEAQKAKLAAAEAELDAQIKALMASRPQIAPNVAHNGKFMWPLPPGGYISCRYGGYDPSGRIHYAIDCAISGGTPIYAAGNGVIVTATNHWSYGNYIIIDHGNGVSSLYAHCSGLAVGAGQAVSKGQVIGYVGSTGYSTGNHLHLEFRLNGNRVNPENYVTPNR